MKLKLTRIFKGETYTIGHLDIDGERFSDTIEDRVRELKDLNGDGDAIDEGEGKIYSQTAIPAGIYNVVYTYSPKFKRLMPRVLDVPFFDGILIHNGSSEKSSAGCIIVGDNTIKGRVTNSTAKFLLLCSKFESALARKETHTIEII